MKSLKHLVIVVVSAIAAFSTAALAEPAISRVFPSSAPAPDERLHDVDHPVMFEPHFANKGEWEKRAADLREQILVAEGLWPMPERSPMNPVIHGRIEREGYTIEKVFFASLPGHYVSGNLYRPTGKTGPFPAVLSPHGHWANGRLYEAPEGEVKKQLAIGAETTTEAARYPLQARCAMLARMGCVVFAYDMVGYADSKPIIHRTGFADVEATLRLQSFMGLQTWNSIRSLDFLDSLPDVDSKRIAVTGASGGATQTLILCAIDDRPAVSFPAVMVSEAMQGGCICENAPLLRVNANNAEIASLFAPKPLGMTSANDWTTDLLTRGFPQIHDIYNLYGAADAVGAWHRSFPHNYNQVSRELMYNWLNKHLHLGQPEPIVEKPFLPVLPAELSVYDAEHPRPADALDALSLRKQMTEASDRQLAKLRKSPAEYRRVVETAVRVMVGERIPAPAQVLLGDSAGPREFAAGVTIEKGTIRRAGSLMRVPYVGLMPQAWNGTVIVWVHPKGKSSLFDEDGKTAAAVSKLLSDRFAVIAPDLLGIGESASAGAKIESADRYAGYKYPGYYFGYNRALIASQAGDILSAIALARGWEGVKSVRLFAVGEAGIPALLARALAGDAIAMASLDLNHFDFDAVRNVGDPALLPGALKYGGVYGMLPLLAGEGQTLLWNPPGGRTELSPEISDVRLEKMPGDPQAILDALSGDPGR